MQKQKTPQRQQTCAARDHQRSIRGASSTRSAPALSAGSVAAPAQRSRWGLLARAMASLNQTAGIESKTVIKEPKKPNSASRACVLVQQSNGKEMVAYVPGIGHNLQEHNIELVRVGSTDVSSQRRLERNNLSLQVLRLEGHMYLPELPAVPALAQTFLLSAAWSATTCLCRYAALRDTCISRSFLLSPL
ncbi:hypothetical protein PYW07_011966 [Mythimna separata]|uniref:Small ribosomal subunit protein uS12m n=1 Tax=Mythimna separata TaxID=271217 RepID=A0AAD8DS72_MYTSE|nr:hypothetical protein PYW07_011966 [Mythimna separata]